MAKKKAPTPSGNYSITFQIGDAKYTGSGATMLEALMQIKPKSYMGLGKVIAVVNGRTSHIPLRLVPLKMRRLFEKPLELQLFAKRLQTLL